MLPSKVAIAVIVVTIFSATNISYADSHCAGLRGEELLLCIGNVVANDSGGECEGLSSLECLQRNIDLDDDGIYNEIDQCPDDPETINGIHDEDGCPEDLPTLTTEEIKKAYMGEINLIFNAVFKRFEKKTIHWTGKT